MSYGGWRDSKEIYEALNLPVFKTPTIFIVQNNQCHLGPRKRQTMSKPSPKRLWPMGCLEPGGRQ